jgi:hypothetical protein
MNLKAYLTGYFHKESSADNRSLLGSLLRSTFVMGSSAAGGLAGTAAGIALPAVSEKLVLSGPYSGKLALAARDKFTQGLYRYGTGPEGLLTPGRMGLAGMVLAGILASEITKKRS